jgi:CheY-like chemotaxis protein
VEDDAADRRAIGEKLEREGFIIQFAKDGREGLQSAVQNKPDLIVLDIVMPDMDGNDYAREFTTRSMGCQCSGYITHKSNR